MKFRITEGENPFAGTPIFRIYRWEGERWSYVASEPTLEQARETLQRLREPKPEVVIEETEP